ncbi:MAG: hypothetical protein AAGJ35_05935, partial [Myxococcota bacterium]
HLSLSCVFQRALAQASPLCSLESLELITPQIDQDSLTALVHSVSLSSLRNLSFVDQKMSTMVERAVIQNPFLSNLQSLCSRFLQKPPTMTWAHYYDQEHLSLVERTVCLAYLTAQPPDELFMLHHVRPKRTNAPTHPALQLWMMRLIEAWDCAEASRAFLEQLQPSSAMLQQLHKKLLAMLPESTSQTDPHQSEWESLLFEPS